MKPKLPHILEQAWLAATIVMVATIHIEPETVCAVLSAAQTVLTARALQLMDR